MVRVAIVEDDANYRAELTEYLKRYEKENHEKFAMAYFKDGDEVVEGYKADYDLILMDIEMPLMDGMTAAEYIRQKDTEVVITFITNTPQFVMRGYEVDALDYVLKPITYFAFSQKIARALARMRRRTKAYISIAIKGGVQKLEVAKITFVEVCDHDLIYHTLEGEYPAKGTMRDVENTLAGQNFFRCNKCYLVNLEHVESVQGNDVMVNRQLVQVSRSCKKNLLDALNDYINEVSK